MIQLSVTYKCDDCGRLMDKAALTIQEGIDPYGYYADLKAPRHYCEEHALYHAQ